MTTVSLFRHAVLSLVVGTFLSFTVLVGVSYGTDAAYKFKTVDIPLHFTFLASNGATSCG